MAALEDRLMQLSLLKAEQFMVQRVVKQRIREEAAARHAPEKAIRDLDESLPVDSKWEEASAASAELADERADATPNFEPQLYEANYQAAVLFQRAARRGPGEPERNNNV